MREEYFNLIQKEKLPDIFSSIFEMKYSLKYNTIKEVLDKYTNKVVTNALFEYQRDYIDLNRVNLSLIKNHIKYLCKKNA